MRDSPGAALPFLIGGGRMAGLIAAFDWSTTPLGPLADWPQSLQTAVGLMLGSPVPFAILWGTDGIMLYNDACGAIAGKRHPAALGSRVRESWPEIAAFNAGGLEAGLTGRSLSYRNREFIIHRDGHPEPVCFNLDYSPLLDEGGKPVAVMAIVTETIRTVCGEQRRAHEHATLARMFEQAPGLAAFLNGPDHVFTMINGTYRELIGEREVLGRPVREALPEIATQGFIGLLDRVFASGEPYIGRNARMLFDRGAGSPPDERRLDFIYQPIVAEDGAVTGIFVQGHDITEQWRTQQALRESEERFRLVAEGAPVMLWMSDMRGACVYLNAMQRAFWGVEPEALAAFDWCRTIHPDDHEQLACTLTAALANHAPFSIETRLRRVDGAYRLIATVARPRFGPDGAFLGMIGVNVDMTAAREAETALQALNATLEQRVEAEIAERSKAEAALLQARKMETLGKLTGGVAHDFNNLLQIISGNLQLLAGELAGNERVIRRIDHALAGVARGSRLASQLLAFGRRQMLEPKVINVGRLVIGMADMLNRTIGEAIEVEIVVAGDLWNAFVDPDQIENALLNLAINARDAMNGTGRLTIEASNAFLDDAYVTTHTDVTAGQYVLLAVSDTGGGMPLTVLEQAFDPFFTTKQPGDGTGLGLSMVYGFVKQSGGHVKIYSEPGQGAVVKLYLPRDRRSEAAPVRTAVDVGAFKGGTETILVAEDDDDVRRTVVEMLDELGYRVLTAKDAASALAVIESGVPVDLLFTDVVMPGPLKSVDLAHQLKQRWPHIAVLFTSGYTENVIVHDGQLDLGIELISKPYDHEALARKLRLILAADGLTPNGLAADGLEDGGLATDGRGAAPPLEQPPARRQLCVLLCEDDPLIRLGTTDLLLELGHSVVEADSGEAALACFGEQPIDLLMTDLGLPDIGGFELALALRELSPELPVIFATGRDDVTAISGLPRSTVLVKPYGDHELMRRIEQLVAG